MPLPTSQSPSTLPADAKCPRCGYEFGIAGQTRCSECGLEIDACAIRAIEVRKVAGRKLAVGLGMNVVALIAIVGAVLLGTRGSASSPYVLLSAGALLVSLAVGCAASTVVRKGERRLWADAWARAHLALFAHWLIVPVAGFFTELEDVIVLVTLWVIAMIISMAAVGSLFRWLCRRRVLLSRSGIATFAFVQIAMSLATVASFVYLILRMLLDSLDFCC